MRHKKKYVLKFKENFPNTSMTLSEVPEF